jgi:acyl carrier protein
MGLEYVQLIMEVEKDFGITIPRETYSDALTTLDSFCGVVIKLAAVQKQELLDRHEVFERVRSIIVDVAGVSPDEVWYTTDFDRDLGFG